MKNYVIEKLIFTDESNYYKSILFFNDYEKAQDSFNFLESCTNGYYRLIKLCDFNYFNGDINELY